MSRRTDAKKARRRKRQAARNDRWLADPVMDSLADDIELAAILETFDERLTERGWVFDEESSDEESALWFYPPSHADVVDPDELVSATAIVVTADDGGDLAHVVFVGTSDDYQFDLDELFDCLEVVESYRLGDPAPVF